MRDANIVCEFINFYSALIETLHFIKFIVLNLDVTSSDFYTGIIYKSMPGRRRCRRWVSMLPVSNFFIPNTPYKEINIIRVEEFEAFRLVDYMGLTQHEASAMMGVSQKTLWNDLVNARFKIADALINGKGMKIEGGNYVLR